MATFFSATRRDFHAWIVISACALCGVQLSCIDLYICMCTFARVYLYIYIYIYIRRQNLCSHLTLSPTQNRDWVWDPFYNRWRRSFVKRGLAELQRPRRLTCIASRAPPFLSLGLGSCIIPISTAVSKTAHTRVHNILCICVDKYIYIYTYKLLEFD